MIDAIDKELKAVELKSVIACCVRIIVEMDPFYIHQNTDVWLSTQFAINLS